MRASRALAVAAAVAVTGLTATAAVAGGERQDVHVTVHPHHVHQGGTLTITVHGCGRGGTISSNAFPHISLHRGDDRGDGRGGDGRDTLSVGARIHDRAAPGRYNLVARCDTGANVATAHFVVLPGRGTRGGLGGSMEPGAAEMGVGAGLVATAAIGGTVFVARRRRIVGTRT